MTADMLRRMLFAAIAGGALVAPPAAAQQPLPPYVPGEETPEMYPDHPHREDTFYFCVACHSFKIVAQQRMSRSRWDDVLTWMTERHKMPDVQGEDRDKMLDYLAAAFPQTTQPRGWTNPFAPK